MSDKIVICVDFDGTLVKHEYPDIGGEIEYAVDTLLRFQATGRVHLILHTMRDGATLTEAVEWCGARGITFWGINENPEQDWTQSRKVYAHHYIDDAAIGCPLIHPSEPRQRPYVDWRTVERLLLRRYPELRDA